tara:strand:- start:7306 stop:8124 length:819 start_codon:yes stop_codon:yes gene_type:complete
MKTIIHATDYSKNAITALKYAYALSTKIGANLWVIHIFDLSMLSADIKETYLLSRDEHIKQKNTKLKEFCTLHLGNEMKHKDIQIEAIENTSVVSGIISKADELFASLIVTGIKGESAVKEFLIGSTTKKLIKKAPCPILAIPENAVLNEINTIVYPTDFEDEDISAIFRLTEIAKTFDATIKIVHISPKNDTEGQQEMEWFKEILKETVKYEKLEFALLFSNKIYPLLKLYIDEVEADLIAMLEREKKGLLKKVFHKDLVKKWKPLATYHY